MTERSWSLSQSSYILRTSTYDPTKKCPLFAKQKFEFCARPGFLSCSICDVRSTKFLDANPSAHSNILSQLACCSDHTMSDSEYLTPEWRSTLQSGKWSDKKDRIVELESWIAESKIGSSVYAEIVSILIQVRISRPVHAHDRIRVICPPKNLTRFLASVGNRQ
jgi:hypothetical protein